MHRVDAVGSSSGVRRELAESIRSLPGWRKGVRQKKTETHQKIIEGSRKACWDSLGDSLKGSGSSLGTRRKITGRRPDDLPQECQRSLDWQKLGLSLSLWSLSIVIIES
ncbi:hypothetical protein B296_00014907 [Ensete ventricosum]|uniref:Uncharacterized protein n=1 Tax=Ensete ventricosum TaxID=4639 RepID=A0A426YB40_ENSVE|nr:hypothetical protein B296_00014907 [Ensete ventricosum]